MLLSVLKGWVFLITKYLVTEIGMVMETKVFAKSTITGPEQFSMVIGGLLATEVFVR